ncbi:hypothetical protein ACPESL_08075 [Psychrobacter pocilloporae]|uniref:hypothetical protein n=1 Tax=Psychrobacter pocilloporae TaxID=1775882 RepID=UPI003C2FCE85
MSFNEPYFAPINNYSNTNKGMPVGEVEAWLDQFPQKRAENKPNGGIIRSIADTRELYLREMSPKERKVARAKAQREHKEALKNLAKQEAQDAKKIAKQLSKWKKEERASEPKQMSKSLQWFLNEIQAKGVFEVSDFDLSKVYLQKLVREARKLGYQIEPVRKSIAIVRYRLIDTQ